LCELCRRAGLDFSIAHCNFQLRGAESSRDEIFVQDLAQHYGKQVFVKRFETEKYALENKLSTQEAARDLRYAWFDELTPATGTGTVLTAQHLDDNIETLLMNLFKGTGIKGIRGMLPKQGKIARPLLFAAKEEIRQFALENNLHWVEDSSNLTDKYTRNFIRHRIIPVILERYPALLHNLSESIGQFRDIEILYNQSIDELKEKLIEKKGNEDHIPILKLKKSVPLRTIIYEIIRTYHFSAAQVDEVIALCDSESGKYLQSPTHRVIKNRKWLIIAPNNGEGSAHIVIDGPGRWSLGDRELELRLLPVEGQGLSSGNFSARIDADKLPFPLLVRKWRSGDYFYPLGMKKKKKLARFFIDNKLSKTDKEKIWVLEGNRKIIWIIGMRIDERFKLTAQTKKILHIEVRMG